MELHLHREFPIAPPSPQDRANLITAECNIFRLESELKQRMPDDRRKALVILLTEWRNSRNKLLQSLYIPPQVLDIVPPRRC